MASHQRTWGWMRPRSRRRRRGGLLPADLSDLLFTAGGEACLVARLFPAGDSELPLPKGFPG